MRKVSLKSVFGAVLCVWTAVGLSVCIMEPVQFTTFLEDEKVIEVIQKGIEKVNITEGSDSGLTAGNKTITGLDPNKYYMVEEWDGDGGFLSVRFVSSGGTRTENLTGIGKVSGRAITGLTNFYNYRVKSAKLLTGSVLWYVLASAPGASDTGKSITINNGEITIPYTLSVPAPPNMEYYLNLSPTVIKDTGSYNMVKIPVSPSGSNQAVTKVSSSIIKLEGRETVTDYVFVLLDANGKVRTDIENNILVLKTKA